MVEKNEEEKELLIVPELPQVPVRNYTQDGKEYELITITEALAEIRSDLKEIKKSVVGK